MKRRGDLLLLAPVVRNRKGFHTDVAAMGRETRLRGNSRGRKNVLHQRAFRLDRFREHDVEIVIGVLDEKARRKSGKPPQQLIDEALELGHGTLLRAEQRSEGHGAFDRTRLSGMRPIVRACSIRKCSATTPPRAGVRPAAVSANCFICRTWIAARARMRSRNRGSNGRKANASNARIAKARA